MEAVTAYVGVEAATVYDGGPFVAGWGDGRAEVEAEVDADACGGPGMRSGCDIRASLRFRSTASNSALAVRYSLFSAFVSARSASSTACARMYVWSSGALR